MDGNGEVGCVSVGGTDECVRGMVGQMRGFGIGVDVVVGEGMVRASWWKGEKRRGRVECGGWERREEVDEGRD